jgi:hypothetical protein
MSSRDHNITHFGAILLPNGSYIDKYGCIHWYNNKGERHREDGPALICPKGNSSWNLNKGNSYWYLYNKGHPFNRWLKLAPISDENKMILKLQYA